MTRTRARPHVSRLVRARRLLAGTLDDRRAIVGRVSPAWIASEAERRVRRSRLSDAVCAHPELGDDCAEAHRDSWINTNRLPKLEPEINASILVGVLLYGTRLYGLGTPDPDEGVACREMENDLVVAAMVHDVLGERDRLRGWLPDEQPVVDLDSIEEQLGRRVRDWVVRVRDGLDAFDAAWKADGVADLRLEPAVASAVAAIQAARLRLTARAAGDGIFATLDPAKRDELLTANIDPDPVGEPFPERPHLTRDFSRAQAATTLAGVDLDTLRLPIEGQLLRVVNNVLEHGVPVRQLVGRYGDAVGQFARVLPLYDRFSPINRRTVRRADGSTAEVEGPYALGTLHLTGFEATRYLHKVRRKGWGTAAGHCFKVAASLERMLDGNAQVSAIAASDCHDVVEDGGRVVAGYDHGLNLFAARFGSPLAALVAEVTDSITCADGPLKAATFRERSTLALPEQLYNVGQLDELQAVATNPDVPYTLHGAMLKLADAAITQEEGLRHPELMRGAWRHSGARVHWHLYSKGLIVRPLLERLCLELKAADADDLYDRRPGAVAPSMLSCLRGLIHWFLDTTDAYAAQNLWLLAGEYRLDETRSARLVEEFFDAGIDDAHVEAHWHDWLDDERLDADVRQRGLAATYRLGPESRPERDLDRLMDYRDTAVWRQDLRRATRAPAFDRDLIEASRRSLRLMTAGAPS